MAEADAVEATAEDQQQQQQPAQAAEEGGEHPVEEESKDPGGEDNVEAEAVDAEAPNAEEAVDAGALDEPSVTITFPEEKPDGVMPMMISIKNMEKYELKTGDGLKDTVPYKLFSKEAVLEEIREVGFYSDFNDFKAEIADYKDEEILVIADPDEVYGQNWMVCLTVEAKELLFAMIDAEARRLQEIKRQQEEEEAQRLAEEEARRNVVYEDKPIVPRERSSFSCIETQSEIEWLDVRPTRKLLRVEMSRTRSEFGAPIKFNDRDAEQSGLIEFRQHKDPNFELKRREQDVGLQACASWTAAWIPNSPWARPEDDNPAAAGPAADEIEIPSMGDLFEPVPATVGAAGKRVANVSDFDFCAESLTLEDFLGARELPRLVEAGSQTAFFRKLNAATQYEHVEISAADREALVEEELADFLNKVLPSVEVALQQNETIDVFANEFHRLRSDEVSGLGNKEDNVLRELRTFTDLVYSNGRALSCVDWHPRSQNVVAVACADPLHFDQRVEVSGQERNSFILIWNFADLIHPQLVLKSPHECRCFAFNPDQPHLVAGGCATGQIIIWDLSHAQDLLRRRNKGPAAAAAAAAATSSSTTTTGDGASDATAGPPDGEEGANPATVENASGGTGPAGGDDEKVDASGTSVEPVEPLMISAIEHSHKRPITHLEWLPASMNVSTSGRVSGDVKYGGAEAMATQFITCASDGHLVIWGPRFGVGAAKPAAAADPNDPKTAGEASRLAEETPWKPIFKTALMRQGSRNFGITKVALRGRIDALLDMLNRQHEHRRESSVDFQDGRPIKGMGMTASGTMFSCVTEEGDMMFADWLGARVAKSSGRGVDKKAAAEAASSGSEAAAAGGGGAPGGNAAAGANAKDDAQRLVDDKVHWVARDHFASCLALRRSPFFPYLLLSVSAHSFNIWKEDLPQPIFSSPLSTGMAHLTCAEWSPTRPGVIMVGKTDGTVDIWDFVDQSHRPSATASITAYAITSMQFRCTTAPKGTAAAKRTAKTIAVGSNEPRIEKTLRRARVSTSVANAPQGDLAQFLALGDATGNLHILDVPRNLRWRMPTEEKLMTAFFERELDRVDHVAKRKLVREKEREAALDLASNALLGMDNNENDPIEENTKEYRKLVLAEEKRFQEMAEKLLKPEDLALAKAGNRKQSPSKAIKSKSKRKVEHMASS